MSKNKKLNNLDPAQAEQNSSAISSVEAETVQAEKKETAQENKKDKTNDNKKLKNKKKDKKEKGKLKRKTKETLSELKKVTWPSFGEVCKKTGVVLVVVLVFAVVLFGIDYGLGALMRLLTGGK